MRGEAAGTSRVYFSFFNRPDVSQDGYFKYNAFINYKSDHNGLSASLFVRNLANKRTVSSEQVSAGFSLFPILGAFDPPRVFGGSIGYSF